MDEQDRLTAFPAKRKMKLYALAYLASKIETGRQYSERDFNAQLNKWHTFGDPATLRRELYNHRFINRANNGSAYWLEAKQPSLEELEKKYV